MTCFVCVSDVSFPSEQFTLLAESLAAYGRAGAVRQGVRTASVGDLHARGQQSIHHVETGLRRSCSQVCMSVAFIYLYNYLI